MHNRSPLVSVRRRNPKAAFKPLPGSDETLECGGPAPLWPFSRCHSTANQRVLLAKGFRSQEDHRERRPKRCQASALQIRITFARRRVPGVRRPGAALACFSLPLNCEQGICLRRDFAPRRTVANVGQSAARPAHSKLGSHLPGVACLECGGPAPLWPVSPCHSTANQGVCLRRDFAPRRTVANVGQSAARPARPAHSKLGSHLPGVAYPCNDSVKRNGQHT